MASTRTLRHVCRACCTWPAVPFGDSCHSRKSAAAANPHHRLAEPQLLQEEQIHSIVEKITKPVDTDAEADATQRFGRGFCLQGRRRTSRGRPKHALRLQPNYFAAHLNLANTLLDLGRYEDALAEFKQALKSKTRRT
ncbi:MAG: tetratricopeptide repeat protein [Nitrospiraceae bacterium]